MRADRLLAILLLLQVHRRITARELAKRLEVSERTIYRDMEALSAAGIPITAERGNGGGLVLTEAFRTNLTGLSANEIQALFLSQPAHILNDLGLRQAAEGALIKLQAVLPAMHRYNADYVRQRIHVDVSSWQQSGEERLTFLPQLQEAIWQEHKISLIYQRGEHTVERVLDPLGLVAKGRIWYLVAAAEDDIRTYRISRIQHICLLDEPCIRPPTFDLAEYWKQSFTSFLANIPRYTVTARIKESVLARAFQAGRFIQIEPVDAPDEQGWLTVRILFEVKDEACGYLLSFGPEIEILEPQELREQIFNLAKSLVAFYEQRARDKCSPSPLECSNMLQ